MMGLRTNEHSCLLSFYSVYIGLCRWSTRTHLLRNIPALVWRIWSESFYGTLLTSTLGFVLINIAKRSVLFTTLGKTDGVCDILKRTGMIFGVTWVIVCDISTSIKCLSLTICATADPLTSFRNRFCDQTEWWKGISLFTCLLTAFM